MNRLDQDFKYLSKGYDINYQKTKRSTKKKLVIVFSFIGILAIIPALVAMLTESNFDNSKRIVIVSPQTQEQKQANTEPEIHEVTIEEAKSTNDKTIVMDNDSYWKITKRTCGEGNNYLSIKDQNSGKALYEGDTVTVNCEL